MKTKAYAKINLGLDVLGRKENGYHELDMVMAPISLYDEIDITISDIDEVIFLGMDIPSSNTVTKAVKLMKETYHFTESFRIVVKKNIPEEAGLGGGSSDAASVMHAINDICKFSIPLDELKQLGEQIGADVPFCLQATLSRVKGIGEIVQPIHTNLSFYIFLVKPEVGCSTKSIFSKVVLENHNSYIDVLEESLCQNDYKKMVASLYNALEVPAMNEQEEIKEIKQQLISFGFDGVLMSGSGSSVFGLTQDKELIDNANTFFSFPHQYIVEIIK